MRFAPYFTFLSFLLCSVQVSAQCGLTVEAGPDAAICPGGGQAQLNASISGPNVTGFSWSPLTGLSDPLILNPIATVSGEVIYTLTAEVFDPTFNLIANGDFSAGDSGFTTDYDPGSGGTFGLLSDEGEYAVSTNSNLTHNNFANCPDHTGGGGMMVVNGSGTAGDKIWCQNVAVMPNTLYSFNAWLMSVISENPAQLQFSVNGAPLGIGFSASFSICDWQQFSETWVSGAVTTAEICITNQNTAPSGNDFAIDDLFFGPVCVQTDLVTVREVQVETQVVSPVALPCTVPATVQLDGTGSSEGALYFYEWTTTNGNIVSGANTRFPSVDQAGIYILTTLYDDGIQQCSDQAFVVVQANQTPVEAGAVVFRSPSCGNPTGELIAEGSSSGPDITYFWTTTNGNIVSGTNAFSVIIDQPGSYEVNVTNTATGCSELAVVEVTVNDNTPTLSVRPPGEFNCASPSSFRLDAFDSESGVNFTINWTTTDGNILEDANTLGPLIDAAGTYTLSVVNNDNGCESVLSVIVNENRPAIVATIASPPLLSCITSAVQLDGAGSMATFSASYTWSTTDGNIVSGGATPSATVNEPGTYVLLVEDPSSGCTSMAFVTVTSATDLPDIALQSPPPFTCVLAQMTLNADGTTTGNDLTYRWSAANGGEIRSGGDSLAPVVMSGGDYTLLVRDTLTGCERDTTFTIDENTTPPVADAGMGFTLSCGMNSERLNGTGSSTGDNFVYEWGTPNGNIVGATDTLEPLISTPGEYTLEVTDTTNGCFSSASILILQDDTSPAIGIAMPNTLTCREEAVTLDASSSATNPSFTREWTTEDGNFVSGTDGIMPAVDAPGTYVLTITDPANGCLAVRSVTVVQNTATPPVEAGATITLSCTTTTDRLGADDNGNGFSYQWATFDGLIAADQDSTEPEVSAAGRYYLTVTNDTTGCTAIDSVDVFTDDDVPAINIGQAQALLTCRDTVLRLNEGATSTTDIRYVWTTSGGNILNGEGTPVAAIDAPGTYRLTVTDTINGCSASDAVTVTRNVRPPAIDVAPPAVLNCEVVVLNLDASASDSGQAFSFSWSSANGNILSGADGPTPTLDAAGDYLLTLTNDATGCTNTETVLVQQDTLRPVAILLSPSELTCRDSSQVLDGSQSDDDLEFGWTWSTFDGSFVGNVFSLMPTINAAGTYELTIRNLTNGCESLAEVTVSANQQVPDINVGQNERTLNCIDTSFILGADAGAVNGLSYAWTEGSAGTVATGPTLEVSQQGTYQLVITDDANGCVATDEVVVLQDITGPEVTIMPVAELNCTVTERTISTAPAPPGFSYIASWTTTTGNITSAADSLDINVDQPGNYQLILLNPANGCTDSSFVVVGQDITPPNANIGIPEVLTCRNSAIQLDGNFSSSGGDFTYRWATADGAIQSGGNTQTPTVTEAGTYVLMVFNTRNGCSAEARTEVEQDDQLPQLSAPVPAQLNCLVSSLEITASSSNAGNNAEINWSTADGNIVSAGNTLAPEVDAPGTYLLTVLNPSTLCMSTLEVVVTEDLAEPLVDLGAGFDLGCDAKPIRLEARVEGDGPFTYYWSSADGVVLDSETTARPLVQGGGTYAVTVTSDANGCVTVADIAVTQTLLLGFGADRTVPGCANPFGSIEFTDVDGGTQPVLYSIDGGATFSMETLADSLQPGRYDLVIQDANGCELMDAINIPSPPELDLSLDPNAVIPLGDAHFINTRTNFADSSLTQITWTPALDLDCTDCLRPTATPDRTTTYVIDVMSSDGCVATDSVKIIVDVLREVYFPTGFSPNGDGINDAFLPFASLTRVTQVQDFTIFDRWGETVFNGTNFLPNNPANGWNGRLDGRPMNPAVFVYSAAVEFVDGRVVVFKGDFVLLR